jgi:aminocarboxymuconate-semialdehyde decarboxylase
MASLVAQCPDRLLGSAQLPVQDPAAAVAELDRAVGDLGLVAAYIGTDYGMTLDDRRFDELYRRLVELDVPLFVHGVTNDGRGPVGDTRLRRFGLDLIVGYTYEETLAAASLVLGGVLDRHPELDVCLSHGGGAIAFLAKRFDSMARFRGSDSDFAASLRRLWFDSHLEPGPARDLVVDTVGLDRMVYGTNFGGWDTPTATDDFDASLTPNANRLLRLEVTT